MSSLRRISFAGSLLLCLLLALSGSSFGDDDYSSSVYRPALLKDEWYSEGWDQLFYFRDGSFVVTQITVVNVGFGTHHAGVFGVLVEADGTKDSIDQSRSNGEWNFSQDKLDLQIAHHQLTGEHPNYVLRLKHKEGEIEIDFTVTSAPWHLGKTLELGKDYQFLSFYAPTLEASGRYRFFRSEDDNDIPWKRLEGGTGIGVRYVNSTGLGDLIQSSTRIVGLGGSAIVPVVSSVLDVDGRTHVDIALFTMGRLIYHSKNLVLGAVGPQTVSGDRCDAAPAEFKVNFSHDQGDLEGSFTLNRLLLRMDPIERLKPLMRPFVRLLNTPVQCRYLATYDLQYDDQKGTTRLQGTALVDQIVMRRARNTSRSDTEFRPDDPR